MRSKRPVGVPKGQLVLQAQAVNLDRQCFVDAIPKAAPNAWDELIDLNSTYSQHFEAIGWPSWKTYAWLLTSDKPLYNPSFQVDDRAKQAFVVKLNDWAKRYFLTDEWLMDWALRVTQGLPRSSGIPITIGEISIKSPTLELRNIRPSVFLTTIFEIPIPEPPVLPRYQALRQTQKDYRIEVGKLIEQYIKGVETLYQENQAKVTPELPSEEHCTWLVQYQCLGKRWSEIARDAKLSQVKGKRVDNTVSDAVKELARKIGLTLRTSKRGR